MCDFPVPYSDKNLARNWFNFNDSTVTPIMPGTLQNTFGGYGGSAYMLVYRQRKLTKDLTPPQIPSYWLPDVSEINANFQKAREFYDREKNSLEILIQDCESHFTINSADSFVSYIDDKDCETQGVRLRLSFTDTISEVKTLISEKLGLGADDFDMVEVQRLQNGFC